MTTLSRNRIFGLALAALILIADQAVKWWVTGALALREEGDQIVINPVFNLTRVNNIGTSLGILNAHSPEMRWGLVAMTAAIAVVVLVWLLRERKLGEIVPLGMVLGGALGNIRDRSVFGYVTDYADLHFGSFQPFLVFNLADAAITIGVVIILARSFLIREKPPQEAGAPATET
jgi:signal peptidase II